MRQKINSRRIRVILLISQFRA